MYVQAGFLARQTDTDRRLVEENPQPNATLLWHWSAWLATIGLWGSPEYLESSVCQADVISACAENCSAVEHLGDSCGQPGHVRRVLS